MGQVGIASTEEAVFSHHRSTDLRVWPESFPLLQLGTSQFLTDCVRILIEGFFLGLFQTFFLLGNWCACKRAFFAKRFRHEIFFFAPLDITQLSPTTKLKRELNFGQEKEKGRKEATCRLHSSSFFPPERFFSFFHFQNSEHARETVSWLVKPPD